MPAVRFLTTDYTYADLSTGISPAIERALEEKKGQSTLLVNLFSQDSFTVGVLEDPEKSLDMDFCREKGIVVRRRQNPGGTVFGVKGSAMQCLYLDLNEPWVPFQTIREAFPFFLERMALVTGELFGLEANYRPVNDIEVEGRKLVATSARLENNVLTLRSVVNVTPADRATMSRALIARPEKFQDKKYKDGGSRFTCLQEEVSREIGWQEVLALARETVARVFGSEVNIITGQMSDLERSFFDRYQARYSSEEWLYANSERSRFRDVPADARKAEAFFKAPAGLMGATILARRGRIHDLILLADFHPSPQTVLADMEQALRGQDLSLAAIQEQVAAVYNRPGVEIPGTGLEDFAALFTKALALL
ncbi:MAG: lipoate--protein ligase family protein [Desulfarculus sp.]|jgi:lipoate-protein ligase A|nr:MAG: lipoate--protein ligase family protein [Desulfarculus sp.]